MKVIISELIPKDVVALVVPEERIGVEFPDGEKREIVVKRGQVVLATGVGLG